MNNQIIENLFVLEYMRSEYSKHFNTPMMNVKFDEYYYGWLIQEANFKVIREILIIKNEYCVATSELQNFDECKYFGHQPKYIDKTSNYIKAD
jgi:hypothetical protein